VTVGRLIGPGERLWLTTQVVVIGIVLAGIVAAAFGWVAALLVLGFGVLVAVGRVWAGRELPLKPSLRCGKLSKGSYCSALPPSASLRDAVGDTGTQHA
jgi:hypothetical protein